MSSRASQLFPFIVGATFVALLVVIIGGVKLYPHYYGATAENIETVSLKQTTKWVAHTLPCTEVRKDEVTTTFRHSVVGFESATFTWEHTPDQVSGIRLNTEHLKEKEKRANDKARRGSARSLASKLDDFLPGVSSFGERKWGAVTFRARDDGDIFFSVDGSGGAHGVNARFAEQVEAARQILVAVAFDIPPTLSKQVLADLLGAGYALADIATLDPTDEAQTIQTLTDKFPASLVTLRPTRIPIRHPLLASIDLKWNTPSRTKSRFDVSFHTRAAFEDKRDAFEKCIGEKSTKSPTPHTYVFSTSEQRGIVVSIQSDGVSTQPILPGGIDAPSFTAFLLAVDACGAS